MNHASAIERVDVYRSQALITRRVRLELEPGVQDVEVPGLPAHLCDDSVRVELLEKAAARVAGVRLEWQVARRDIPLRTELEAGLLKLNRELAEVRVERERERDRTTFMESLAPGAYPAEKFPESMAFGERRLMGAWLQLLDYLRQEATAARERIRKLDRKAQRLQEEIAAATDQLEKQTQAEAEKIAFLRKTARLHIELRQPLPALNARISYLVPAARWIPEYELRVFDDRDEAELVLKALAAQKTGEDWEGVAMSFSAADLSRSAEIPELESWRIGKAQPPPKSGWRALPEGLTELFEAYDGGMQAIPAASIPAARALPSAPRLGEPEPLAGAGAELLDEIVEESRVAVKPEPPPEPPRPRALPAPAAAAPGLGEFTRLFRAGGAPPAPEVTPMFAPAAEPETEAAAANRGVAASRTALDYSRLLLRGPEDLAMRGRLKAVSPAGQIPLPRLDGLPLPELARSAGHFAVRYPMEAAGSVPADGQVHSLTLLRREGRIRRTFRCVPLFDDKVYHIVEFENPLQLPLLAGLARVYRGADFVVTSPLPVTGPGKTVAVNLGVEPEILVARNTSFKESTTGLLGGETVLEHKIQIEVRSRLPRPARVEIFERTPHSPSDDIKVEVTRTEPPAEPYDQTDRDHPVRGGWRFRLELGPRERRTCVLEYRILMPSKQVLVGGNRRD